jgi:hypothetical protein
MLVTCICTPYRLRIRLGIQLVSAKFLVGPRNLGNRVLSVSPTDVVSISLPSIRTRTIYT